MKNSVNSFLKIAAIYLTVVFLAININSCSSLQFKYSTLNHAGYVDGIYNSPSTIKIDTLSYSQFKWKLRNNFQFRYDYAQYALSQPRSFDWNNKLLGFRYNRFNNWRSSYYGYNNYWNRTQMWNDWAWDYPWFTPYRWSMFGFDRWGYHHMNYNYGWGYPYYGDPYNWNYRPNYNRRTNVAYINGRRGSNNVIENRVNVRVRTPRSATTGNTLSVDEIADDIRVRVNNRRIINNNSDDKTIRSNPRIYLRPESSNNGRRRGNGEIVPVKPVVPRQPSTVQPRQVRRGQRSPVLQQTRTRVQSNSQGRNGSSKRQN